MDTYLIDSHCHLHDRETYEFALGRQQLSKQIIRATGSESAARAQLRANLTPDKILVRAHAAGVRQLICIGTSHTDSLHARDFAATHDDIFWTYGIHPDEAGVVGATPPSDIDSGALVSSGSSVSKRNQEEGDAPGTARLVAIGEVGLDYRNGRTHRAAQLHLFEQMLDLALRHDLPLVFHIREAFDDFFAVLDNFSPTSTTTRKSLRGVVHSFSDDKKNLDEALSRGFYIGVNGLATFADLPLPPLFQMLLETDAPFLTPSPNRGKINESAYVADIARYISTKTGVEYAKVAAITTANARALFRLPGPILPEAETL